MMWMTSSPYNMQKRDPTREQAERAYDFGSENFVKHQDANDMIYAFDASRFYNPEPNLSTIKCAFFAVNSADDECNPPELGILDRDIKLLPKGRYILIPWSEKTSGHGTHSNPTVWGDYLKQLLEASEPAN
jgi:homoserine O-acetyltransferase